MSIALEQIIGMEEYGDKYIFVFTVCFWDGVFFFLFGELFNRKGVYSGVLIFCVVFLP